MVPMFGDYAGLATGQFSCFDFGAPFCAFRDLPVQFAIRRVLRLPCCSRFSCTWRGAQSGWRGFGQFTMALASWQASPQGPRQTDLMPAAV